MALQDILKKILDEADAEVREIEKSFDEKKKALTTEFANLEKQDEAMMKEKIESAIVSIEKKMHSMTRRESAKKRLEMKHEIISNMMRAFLEKIENADEKTYGQILEKLFEKAKGTSGKVYAPPKRIEITTKYAPQGFDVVAHKDIAGGFIIESDGIKIDNTFQTLIFEEFAEPFTLYFAEELKIAA
jgi:vacuolar-type H+-ATPase subunit E/Vma4